MRKSTEFTYKNSKSVCSFNKYKLNFPKNFSLINKHVEHTAPNKTIHITKLSKKSSFSANGKSKNERKKNFLMSSQKANKNLFLMLFIFAQAWVNSRRLNTVSICCTQPRHQSSKCIHKYVLNFLARIKWANAEKRKLFNVRWLRLPSSQKKKSPSSTNFRIASAIKWCHFVIWSRERIWWCCDEMFCDCEKRKWNLLLVIKNQFRNCNEGHEYIIIVPPFALFTPSFEEGDPWEIYGLKVFIPSRKKIPKK